MNIVFKYRGERAGELRKHAEQRMQLAFRRRRWPASIGTVRLADVNGTRGGVDKRCQVAVKMANAGSVVVTSTADDWRTAIDIAVRRASTALLRLTKRKLDAFRASGRKSAAVC